MLSSSNSEAVSLFVFVVLCLILFVLYFVYLFRPKNAIKYFLTHLSIYLVAELDKPIWFF